MTGFGDAEALEARIEDVGQHPLDRVLPELIVPGEWNGVQLWLPTLLAQTFHQKASLDAEHPQVSLALGHLVAADLVEEPSTGAVLELEEFVVLGAPVNQTDYDHLLVNP